MVKSYAMDKRRRHSNWLSRWREIVWSIDNAEQTWKKFKSFRQEPKRRTNAYGTKQVEKEQRRCSAIKHKISHRASSLKDHHCGIQEHRTWGKSRDGVGHHERQGQRSAQPMYESDSLRKYLAVTILEKAPEVIQPNIFCRLRLQYNIPIIAKESGG